MVNQTRVVHFCMILCCSIQGFVAVKRDVVFVVDKSGSILQSDFDKAIDFLKDTITALTIGTSNVLVSVVTFSDTYNEEFALNGNTDQSSLLTALEGLKSSITTGGGTFTADALNHTRDNSFDVATKGARADAVPIVVVITDGLSQNTLQTSAAADSIRSDITNSIIYVIGIGSQLSPTTNELLLIASDPDSDNVMYVTDFEYICNLVPTLAVKIDNSVSASVPAGCTQTTTTVFVAKGGGGGETTATTTTTTPTTTATTADTGSQSGLGGADAASSDFAKDNIPLIAGTTAGGVAVVGTIVAAGVIYRLKKTANQVVDISGTGP